MALPSFGAVFESNTALLVIRFLQNQPSYLWVINFVYLASNVLCIRTTLRQCIRSRIGPIFIQKRTYSGEASFP